MRAAVYRKYGSPDVLKIEKVDAPVMQEGHDDRVLIKVYASSVNPFDYFHRSGFIFVRFTNGLLKPKQTILGIDVAGTVEAVGKQVSRFSVGDAVFGIAVGSHAEYVRARENNLAKKPDHLSFVEAGVIPTVALTALQALRDVAHLQPGQQVLIYGASGGVGHLSVQLARYFGAHVTAVCSTANLDWVKALGADEVIDYTRQDFAKSGIKYDLILDAVARRTFYNSRTALTKNGVYITENLLKPGLQALQILTSPLLGGGRGKAHLSEPNKEDMELLADLLSRGMIRSVIEQVYPLDQIADAHRHIEKGHAKGKIGIRVID